MRTILVFLVLCFISCNQNAQETIDGCCDSANIKKENFGNNLTIGNSNFDNVRIDSVADIKKGTNELTSGFIKQRLQMLVGNYLKEKCQQNGLTYPPKFIMFRSFKHEKEFEVWAGNSQKDSLRRILYVGVCAVDSKPGTKLQMGDGKTPEGFYNSALQYGSPNGFMWIKLNNSEIDNYGSVGIGSSFKMCLDYPNLLDKQRTKTILKTKNPGSAICIHANCVTAGCISFVNKDFLPIFLAALGHNSSAYGPIKIHIFPFRFDKISEKDKTYYSENVPDMKKELVFEAWDNLGQAYFLFNKTRKALKVNIVDFKKYSYSNY